MLKRCITYEFSPPKCIVVSQDKIGLFFILIYKISKYKSYRVIVDLVEITQVLVRQVFESRFDLQMFSVL